MAIPKREPPRGLLHAATGGERVGHARYVPSADLAELVEHYWAVRWDFRGVAPCRRENLPHPSVHLVIEQGSSRIVGVPRGKYSVLLEGEGRVFGIKFLPGAFHPFLRAPLATLTDREVDLHLVFGEAGDALARAVLAEESDDDRIELAEAFLRERIPPHDAHRALVGRIVAHVVADHAITRVEDVVRWSGVSARSLQRLFHRYVGVTPKWVIRRYRLHEAVDRLASAPAREAASLALDLGYADQAHFINDFRSEVGQSPAAYARTARGR
jgi:AraC-like DNA-binding protein